MKKDLCFTGFQVYGKNVLEINKKMNQNTTKNEIISHKHTMCVNIGQNERRKAQLFFVFLGQTSNVGNGYNPYNFYSLTISFSIPLEAQIISYLV